MEDLGTYPDFPSPPNSMYYVYADSEPYLSESQSPNNSAVSFSTLVRGKATSSNSQFQYDNHSAGDGSNSSRYPSPGHEDGESADSAEQKPAAKRKRENRYKNAPPAVLSVRGIPHRSLAEAQKLTTHPHSAGEPRTAPRKEPTASARTRG